MPWKARRARLACILVAALAYTAIPATARGAPSAGPAPCVVSEPSFGFGVGSWPSGCWRPYGNGSPFNRRLPADPVLHPDSAGVVERLTGWGGPADLRAGVADTGSDWQHPTYYSRSTDPLFTVRCRKPWGRCELEGMQLRIPNRARPAGGLDAHLTVVDQAAGWEYDLWQVRSKPTGGGGLEVSWGGRTRIDGDGLGSDSTAAHFGNLAGIVRAQELERENIEHALFMVVKCDSGEWVYPARGLGDECPDPRSAPAEGMRLQLALSDAQIDALGEPAWKKAILRAMARYGLFVGDTGGSPWEIELESGSTYTSFGYEDPVVRYAREAGIARGSDGLYHFDLASGIDWSRALRVVHPCVSRGIC